jgi:hypothetical protein
LFALTTMNCCRRVVGARKKELERSPQIVIKAHVGRSTKIRHQKTRFVFVVVLAVAPPLFPQPLIPILLSRNSLLLGWTKASPVCKGLEWEMKKLAN